MRTLQLIMVGVWGLFALALMLVTIADFGLLTLLMAVGCGGLAVISFLNWKWSDRGGW